MIEPTSAMETFYQDLNRSQCWPRRSLSVIFERPDHLMDSLLFCQKRGQLDQFMLAIGGLLRMFVNDAAGRSGFKGGPDGVEPPVPGQVVRLTFGPDSPRRPSFIWRAEIIPDKPGAKHQMILHGGLIYRDNGGWSIHT